MKSAKLGLKNTDIILGLQFEAQGVGKLARYLSELNKYDTLISCKNSFLHYDRSGEENNEYLWVFPEGITSKTRRVLIGPDAIFKISYFKEELRFLQLNEKKIKVVVHPHAKVLLSNVAMDLSIENHCLAKELAYSDKEFSPYVCTVDEWDSELRASRSILGLATKGFSSSINQKHYVLPDENLIKNYDTLGTMSSLGVPMCMLKKVYGVCSPFPMSFNLVEKEHYADQIKINKEDIEDSLFRELGEPEHLFNFSFTQLQKTLFHCQPDYVYLDNAEYLEEDKLNETLDMIETAAASRYSDAQVSLISTKEGIQAREVKPIDTAESLMLDAIVAYEHDEDLEEVFMKAYRNLELL